MSANEFIGIGVPALHSQNDLIEGPVRPYVSIQTLLSTEAGSRQISLLQSLRMLVRCVGRVIRQVN